MKYSNTTLRELNAQYRSVLKKCFLFNAVVLVGLVVSTTASAGAYDNLLELTPENPNIDSLVENQTVTSEYGSVILESWELLLKILLFGTMSVELV